VVKVIVVRRISDVPISGHFLDARFALVIETGTEFQKGCRLSLYPESFGKRHKKRPSESVGSDSLGPCAMPL